MNIRDSAMTALILGFFASSWFGWAQERPPLAWRSPLIVGALLSLIVAVAGGVLAWRNRSAAGSALSAEGALRRYGIIVGVEFGIAAAGAAGIALWGRSEYIASWICLVVGVHFLPMAPVLRNPFLVLLGLLLMAVAVAARRSHPAHRYRPERHHRRGGRRCPARLCHLGCCLRRRVVRAEGRVCAYAPARQAGVPSSRRRNQPRRHPSTAEDPTVERGRQLGCGCRQPTWRARG
jgi:hypothetical protein